MNSTPTMDEVFVDVDDGRLYTESIGDRAAPPVLLIMGAMASGAWWPRLFCARLSERGRFVIRYDHRDTGRSNSSGPGGITYSTETLADDALSVLNAYKIESAHLVGMSLGGYLAQLLALKAPRRVRTLTTIASECLEPRDPSMPPMDPRLLEYHSRAASLNWTDREAVLDYQVGAWRLLTGSAHPFDEAFIRCVAEEDWDRTTNPLSAFHHAGLREPAAWVGRLDEIQAPALIIHGTEDHVVPMRTRWRSIVGCTARASSRCMGAATNCILWIGLTCSMRSSSIRKDRRSPPHEQSGLRCSARRRLAPSLRNRIVALRQRRSFPPQLAMVSQAVGMASAVPRGITDSPAPPALV